MTCKPPCCRWQRLFAHLLINSFEVPEPFQASVNISLAEKPLFRTKFEIVTALVFPMNFRFQIGNALLECIENTCTQHSNTRKEVKEKARLVAYAQNRFSVVQHNFTNTVLLPRLCYYNFVGALATSCSCFRAPAMILLDCMQACSHCQLPRRSCFSIIISAPSSANITAPN